MEPIGELLRWLTRAGGTLFAGSVDVARGTLYHLSSGIRDVAASFGAAREALARTGAAMTGVLWGGVVVLGLLAGAVLLRVTGVDDVFGALSDRPDDEADDVAVTVTEIDAEAVTDERGHFSAALFHRATGLSPSEFVHLIVERNGGRVPQAVLAQCLPWSRGTASRYLDELESAGAVERVRIGNRNVVCLPSETPTDGEAD